MTLLYICKIKISTKHNSYNSFIVLNQTQINILNNNSIQVIYDSNIYTINLTSHLINYTNLEKDEISFINDIDLNKEVIKYLNKSKET